MRHLRGRFVFAAIQPQGRAPGVWALPKGLVDPGEQAEQTALREIEEETGVRGRPEAKLGDIRYVYTRDGERIFKVVSFFLFRYSSGRLGRIAAEMRREVAAARWLPLEEAERLLAYKGEQEMAAKARAMISTSCPPTH